MDRRGFLAGTALSAVALAVTGCQSGTPEPAAPAGTGKPRRGGRLRAIFPGGSGQETLDPHLPNLYVDYARVKALFDKLADFGSDLAPQPRLAASWQPSKDLATWRVKLRQATFHNGKPVRAADVLYSYQRIKDPKRSHRAKSDLAPIDLDRSRAVSDREIEFVLDRPLADFPNVLAAFGAYIVQAGADDFAAPVGSGPFSFGSFTPGRSAVFKRYAEYWDGAPYLDELEIVIGNEESARVNALIAGQVEYAHDLTPTTARAHARTQGIQVLRMPRSSMHAFAMKLDRPPFDKLEVRQAFGLLADRQQLVDTVLPDSGEVGNDLYGKGYEYYATSIPQRTQDIDQAKWLLKKAGAQRLTVALDTSSVASGFVEAASVFADQASKAGITVRPRMGNEDTFWSDIMEQGSLSSYRSGAMPIDTHIVQRLLTGSPTNVTKWRREDFDELHAQAQSTVDAGKRAELYVRMQQMLHTEGGFLVWGFADWLIAARSNVHGIADAAANTLDWGRFDKVWLA
jgi:peptide/nickel transport system substrate-binding protein